ncbi:MAG TPA: LCP family protein [Coriobacteriia bacterium]|nr:LCP family protein [Coriobacteriia bacterium]
MARSRRSSRPAPKMPTGWRATKRNSRSRKEAERAIRAHETREKVSGALDLVRWVTRNGVYGAAMAILAAGLVVALAWGVATAVNAAARWYAMRGAPAEASAEVSAERARDNLLVIGVTEGRATGFLAMRAVPDERRVFGIAIPDATFMEVPGQGFDRIGDSYAVGGEGSLAAITNFFTVPFASYVAVSTDTYQNALTGQSVEALLADVESTNLADEELARWSRLFADVTADDVALIPLPVEPVTVGSQTYFEPQRREIADLVSSWWGVALAEEDRAVRVIVYNGSGRPGVAGQAAQELIRGGFRVVDTKNADSFDYETTQIVVQRGDAERGAGVREVLGVGDVVMQPASQEVADVIIIIGADYQPTAPDAAP